MRKAHPLAGSDVGFALGLLRRTFPDAEIVATHAMDDQGAIVQFVAPHNTYGAHGTALVRWGARAGSVGPAFAGHYFDDGFAADVDFAFRVNRGY